jgi:hypothetical protein
MKYPRGSWVIGWWRGEKDVTPPTHHPVLQQPSGQIFKDDVNGLLHAPIYISFLLGDIIDSGLGLSHRPARLHRLAGRYDNPMTESAISLSRGLRFGHSTEKEDDVMLITSCYISVHMVQSSAQRHSKLIERQAPSLLVLLERQSLSTYVSSDNKDHRGRKVEQRPDWHTDQLS